MLPVSLFPKNRNAPAMIPIPSGMLEDKLMGMFSTFLSEVAEERLTYEGLKERMKGVWLLIMLSDATHALVVWNNLTAMVSKANSKGKLVDACKTARHNWLHNSDDPEDSGEED